MASSEIASHKCHNTHFSHWAKAALVLLLLSISAQARAGFPFPADFGQWARERTGPVVFPEGSSRSWEEVTGLAKDLGAQAVKTWLGADKPGDALTKIQTEPYRELVRQFKVVHFNISPGFVATNYKPGKIDPAMLDAVRNEWRGVTLFLCKERKSPEQIFLLSVGGELNCYLGTAKAYPEFPVAEYVNACHEAKEAALASLDPKDRVNVYSVAEFQGDIEYDRFAKQWAPQFQTDLISLSYYTFYRPLVDALAVLRDCVKPLGSFGDHRLMLGEYGPSLEVCNWNQAEHVRWHNDILHEAFKQHLQFAFFYEMADHEFVINTGSHDGLITWSPGPTPRLAWRHYRCLYHGQNTTVPQMDLYEVPQHPWTIENDSQGAELAVNALCANESNPKPGQKISLTASVVNSGKAPSKEAGLNFFVDDRLVAWGWLPTIPPGGKIDVSSQQGDARFVWTAVEGRHQATAVADPVGKNGLAQKGQKRNMTFEVK